jgi:anti-sigma B factor antagonist
MEMKEEKKDNVLVIHLKGELMGGESTLPFQKRIDQAIREERVNVVVDMADVKWMNSAGLGILMACLTTLRGSDGDLRLADVPERVRRPLEITKLDGVIRIFTTMKDAVRSFGEGA